MSSEEWVMKKERGIEELKVRSEKFVSCHVYVHAQKKISKFVYFVILESVTWIEKLRH